MPTTADDVAALLAQPESDADILEPLVAVKTLGVYQGGDYQPSPDIPRTQTTPQDVAAMFEADDNERLATMFRQGLTGSADRQAGVLALARQTRVPTGVIEQTYDGFKASWEAAKFDPKAWREANPLLARIALNSEAGQLVTHDEKLSTFQKFWKRLQFQYENHDADPLAPFKMSAEESAQLDAKAAALSQDLEAVKSRTFVTGTPEQRRLESLGVLGRLMVPGARYAEASRGLDVSRMQFQLMTDRMRGVDTYELEKQIVDAQNSLIPVDYEESGLSEAAGTALQGVASEFALLPDVGVGAGVGAVVGGAAGALTKKPGAAIQGAKAGLKLGAKAGLLSASFVLESGSAYGDYQNLTTTTGERLTNEEATGGAIIYGALAAAVEMGSTETELAGIKGLLKRDLVFRQFAREAAKQWLKSAGSEGSEEVIQSATRDAVQYFLRAHANGSLLSLDSYPSKSDVDVAAYGQSFYAGALGGLAIGGVGGALGMVNQLIQVDRSLKSGQVVAAIAGLKDSPTVRAAPQAVADGLQAEAERTGMPISDPHVTASEFVRLFQENGADWREGATTLLGDEGPSQVQEALAAGGKFRVPLATYLERWGGTKVAEALVDDVAMGPELLTKRELKENGPAIEEAAKAFVEAFGKASEPTDAERKLDQVEQQLVATGKQSASEARLSMKPLRAFVRTLAENTGRTVDEVLQDFEVQVANAAAEELAPENILARHLDRLDAPARAREKYIDSNTGLLNETAFAALPADPAKPLVGHISVEGIKYLNDNASHDKADHLYRAVAVALHGVDPMAAKVGGDFVVRVANQAELDQVLERARAAMGVKGFELTGHIGADIESAKDAHQAANKALVEQGKRADPRPTDFLDEPLPPQRPLGLPDTFDPKTATFPDAQAKAEVPADLIKALGQRGDLQADTAYFDSTYLEPSGALTSIAWNLLPRKAAVASLDLKGLRKLNDTLGKGVGDLFIRRLAERAMHLGGYGFDFAHLHGDEYALQHNDANLLELFLLELKSDLDASPLEVAPGDERVVEFRYGIGERTLEAADRDLNERKRLEAKRASNVSAVDGGRSESPGPVGDNGAGERSVRQSAGAEEGAAPGEVSAPAEVGPNGEDLAGALKFIARLQKKNRALAAQWLAFTQGQGPRVAVPPALEQALADRFGVVDPAGYSFTESGQDISPRVEMKSGSVAKKKSGGGGDAMQRLRAKQRDEGGLRKARYSRAVNGTDRYDQSSVALRTGDEKLPGTGKGSLTRDIAVELEKRQRKAAGVIARNDTSEEAAKKIAGWMAEEVRFEFRPENRGNSGVGWYSKKWRAALDTFGDVFPELKSDKKARNLFTLLVAVTSNGEKVYTNFKNAVRIYRGFRDTQALKAFTTQRGVLGDNLKRIAALLEDHGLDDIHSFLLQKRTVGELRAVANEFGVKFGSGYLTDQVMPMAAVVFGPKLGAFYANLMGQDGYLTMDRWWSRTFNRYRGLIIPQATRKGLNRFKALLGRPEMDDMEAVLISADYRASYEERGFKDGTEIEKAANTIYKAEFEQLKDTPFNGADREFMLRTAKHAQSMLKADGIKVSVADIQAILWYYEKRLYRELGARGSPDVSYEEVARRVAAEVNGAGEGGAAAGGVRRSGQLARRAPAHSVEGPDGAVFDQEDAPEELTQLNQSATEPATSPEAPPSPSPQRVLRYPGISDAPEVRAFIEENVKQHGFRGIRGADLVAFTQVVRKAIHALPQFDSPEADALREQAAHWFAPSRATAEYDNNISIAMADRIMREVVDTAPAGVFFQADGGSADADAPPRGFVHFGKNGLQRVFRINFNENADLSTFLHENAHVFLEVFADAATRPDASEKLKADFATALKWLGVNSREEIQRSHHEKWAQGFERYLWEGKAPSRALAAAFERFKLWMKAIYRSVASLGGELPDDIRGVFDRLLATEDEVERTKRAMGLKPVFRSAAEAGMTPEAWVKHLDLLEQATSHAERQAELRALKDKLREAEGWWKKELAEEVAKAEAEYEELPARQAQQLLRGTPTGPWLGVRVALNRFYVEAAVGAEAAKEFRTAKDGIVPDDMATLLGYPTGAEMLRAVAAVPEKGAWVKATAEQRMREKHHDVMVERDLLRAEVEKGLNGDITLQFLLEEWAALERRAAQPAKGDFGQEILNAAENARRARRFPFEAIKRAAKTIAAGRAIGELKAGSALQAERAAANRAARAAAKGDFAQALVFKQQQILNMLLHKELREATEEREKFLALADKLAGDKERARLGKARPIYRDGIDWLLESFGLRKPTPRESTPSVNELTLTMEGDGATVGFDEAALANLVAKPVGWKKLTVAEMRLLDGALRNIQGAARAFGEALLDGKRVDKADVIAAILDEAGVNLPLLPPIASSKSAETWWQSFKGGLAGIDGDLLRPEVLLSWIGGKDLNSTAYRALIQPLQEAKHREADLLKQTIKPIVEAFEKVPKAVRARFMEAVDGKRLFPEHTSELPAPTRRFELLVLALNSGNESNLQRLTAGRNITLAQVTAALNTLTKQELDWVQSVWDAAESLWPLAAALEERDSGLVPPKLALRPLETAHGTYRGGYFPAVYDPRVTLAGEKAELRALADVLDPSYTRPGTPQSHLKRRVDKFAGIISLEPTSISRHLAQVAHDIAFREPLKSVAGILLSEDVQNGLKAYLGQERTRVLMQWLKDVGQMRAAESVTHGSRLLGIAKALKAGTVTAALGYSLTTAAGDLSQLLAALPVTDLRTKHWAQGLLEVARAPLEAADLAESKSGELRSRRDQLQRELAKQVRSLTAKGPLARGPLAWVKEHAFAFLEATDRFTSTPMWLGAYRQALADRKPEAEAITFADALVRKLFPSHSAVDAPSVLRDKGWLGASLLFYGFFSSTYNVMRDELHDLHTAEDAAETAKAAPRVAGRLLAYFTVVSVLAEFLSGRGKEPDEEWLQWYLRKLLLGGLTSLPLVGDAAKALEAKVLGKPAIYQDRSAAGLALGLGEALWDLPDDAKEADKRIVNLVRALGPFVRLPTSQPLRTAKYLFDLAAGDREARNPADFASGVVYGERDGQPANPLNLVGDAISGPR